MILNTSLNSIMTDKQGSYIKPQHWTFLSKDVKVEVLKKEQSWKPSPTFCRWAFLFISLHGKNLSFRRIWLHPEQRKVCTSYQRRQWMTRKDKILKEGTHMHICTHTVSWLLSVIAVWLSFGNFFFFAQLSSVNYITLIRSGSFFYFSAYPCFNDSWMNGLDFWILMNCFTW